ncbi:MAG: hypothetical protein Q8R36_04180 [bacterium]|nr:hypothetical protein [bacterium]
MNDKVERKVRKFYPLGADVPYVEVGFQLNFNLPLSSLMEEWVKEVEALNADRLVTWERAKNRVHVVVPASFYEPGFIFRGKETKVIFPGNCRGKAQQPQFLIFRRNNPEHFMVCGRTGPEELFAFGFSIHKRVARKQGWANEGFQPVAFPGKTGVFNPLFIKMALGGEYRGLVVEARDLENMDVLVTIREVFNDSLPPHVQREEDPNR